ncbi:MAG: Holliday junction branch migration protein RuvA [Deltaproteobacteria bacterium]|nr:Holliday junction branch migration protein RuvA [Deltaproteobacteria bacterium]MBW2253040.1 Holliday junction branch migration protein RuvA [Deltaproteobacteria bacterium]
MIALLRGRPLFRNDKWCVLDVNGVGYEVFATNRGMDAWFQEDEVEVHVATYVREDAITLYGFSDATERSVYQLLMTVTGVGPRVALAALDAFTVPELALAVEEDDIASLTRITGVGKRTAQRLVLELKGKMPLSFPHPGSREPVSAGPDTLVLALQRLGYSRFEIARASKGLAEAGVGRDAPVADRLRAALKILYGN